MAHTQGRNWYVKERRQASAFVIAARSMELQARKKDGEKIRDWPDSMGLERLESSVQCD